MQGKSSSKPCLQIRGTHPNVSPFLVFTTELINYLQTDNCSSLADSYLQLPRAVLKLYFLMKRQNCSLWQFE